MMESPEDILGNRSKLKNKKGYNNMKEIENKPKVEETLFHATILAHSILDKFHISTQEPFSDDFMWLLQQLADFATEMHTLAGKFVVEEIGKNYLVIPIRDPSIPSDNIGKDMVLTYTDPNGIFRKYEYRTIMEFLDENINLDTEDMEEIFMKKIMKLYYENCSNFKAIFFDNPLNIKETTTMDEMIKHCQDMVS